MNFWTDAPGSIIVISRALAFIIQIVCPFLIAFTNLDMTCHPDGVWRFFWSADFYKYRTLTGFKYRTLIVELHRPRLTLLSIHEYTSSKKLIIFFARLCQVKFCESNKAWFAREHALDWFSKILRMVFLAKSRLSRSTSAEFRSFKTSTISSKSGAIIGRPAQWNRFYFVVNS